MKALFKFIYYCIFFLEKSKAEEPKTPPPSPQNEKEETNVAKSTEVPVKEAPASKGFYAMTLLITALIFLNVNKKFHLK